MELVKDVETDHKDYVFIRSIIKKGYNSYTAITHRCTDPNVRIKDSAKKLKNLVKWGQVETKSYRKETSGNIVKKYYLKKQKSPSVYSAAGIDQLGGWQADSSVKGRLDFNSLLHMVSKFYDEPKKDILSTSRKRELATCRQIFCYIARFNMPNVTLKQIGDFLGGRDHSTVIHSIRVAEDFMTYDKQFKSEDERLVLFINKKL